MLLVGVPRPDRHVELRFAEIAARVRERHDDRRESGAGQRLQRQRAEPQTWCCSTRNANEHADHLTDHLTDPEASRGDVRGRILERDARKMIARGRGRGHVHAERNIELRAGRDRDTRDARSDPRTCTTDRLPSVCVDRAGCLPREPVDRVHEQRDRCRAGVRDDDVVRERAARRNRAIEIGAARRATRVDVAGPDTESSYAGGGGRRRREERERDEAGRRSSPNHYGPLTSEIVQVEV